MIRIVVTGSECTGKTTLAEDLADHYNVLWVPEYARQLVLEKGSPPEHSDVEAIGRGQVALEDRYLADAAAQGSRLLIHDTNLLSTVVYSHHYYGDCPDWIERALEARIADLYLLAGIDVPWIPDGDLRDRGDRREEMQGLFRSALSGRGLNFSEIQGSPGDRLRQAVQLIDELTRR